MGDILLYWAALCLVILTAITPSAHGFLPNHRESTLTLTGTTSTHEQITDRALRRAAALFMDDYSSLYPDQDKVMATAAFRDSLATFKAGSVKPDLVDPLADDPIFHFDNEKFIESNDNMLKQREEVLSMIATGDWTGARDQSGMLFGTLQEFYSHSDWVEINIHKSENDINSALADPEQTANLGTIAGAADVTCVDCVNPSTGTCINNIVTTILDGRILTSGYSQLHTGGGTPPANTKPSGKCSHGGMYDITATHSATGGINKDTDSDQLSPHNNLHNEAADLVEDATVAS